MKKNNLITFILLPFLSGLFVQLSLAPANIFPLAFVGLIPLLFAISRTETALQSVAVGVLTGFFYNLVGSYWVYVVFQSYFSYSELKSGLLFILFAFVGQLQFAIFAPLARYVIKGSLPRYAKVLLYPILFVGAECIAFNFFAETMGFALIKIPGFTYLFRLLGYKAMTATCVLVSGIIFSSFIDKKFKAAIISIAGVLTVLVFAANWQKRIESNLHTDKYNLTVAVIQPNVSTKDKFEFDAILATRERLFKILMTMSEDSIKKNPNVELIVWPETSFPASILNPTEASAIEMKKTLTDFILRNHVAVILGSNEPVGENHYNEAVLLQDTNGVVTFQDYKKTILAFMGEYNPFSNKNTVNLGSGPTIFKLKLRNGKTAGFVPMICYESMSRTFLDDAIKLGHVSAIVTISNESWFGIYGAPYSFFMVNKMRAIETGIPLIKSGNSGISGFVMPDGSVLSETKPFTQAVIVTNLLISTEE